MTTQPQYISVTLPVSQALERVKRLLFQPFDLGKWFTIGFCAWLAGLGERGFFGTGHFHSGRWQGLGTVHASLIHAMAWIGHNLFWLLPVVVAATLLGLALRVLLLWLSSRGRFMFLHCVALDRAEVAAPWSRFGREANSLFWFRLVFGLCKLLVVLPLVAGAVLVVWGMVQREATTAEGILTLIGIGAGFFLIAWVGWVVSKLLTDFIVPIQFLRGGGCLAAWRTLLGLMAGNIGHFILYLLFRIVLGLAITVLLVAVVLMTCCIAGCFMAIPFLGTVVKLPVLAFVRAYSAHYLAQYGSEWDVFAAGTRPDAT